MAERIIDIAKEKIGNTTDDVIDSLLWIKSLGVPFFGIQTVWGELIEKAYESRQRSKPLPPTSDEPMQGKYTIRPLFPTNLNQEEK